MKHLYSSCVFSIKTHCKQLSLWKETWLQKRVSPGIGWHPMPLLSLIRHHNKIKPLFIPSYNVWEFTPASSVKYINHFLSRCHSLSLLFLTQLVWCPPGTDLFSYGDGHEVLYGHFHRIMERRVETFWMLIWGSSSMSWWTWLILALVMDVTLWPVWSLCLSDSSPHSNWATHLWTVRCEGIHSTPPLTKYWCICIAANPWYVFLILTCAAICKISMPSDNNYWSTVIPHMILNAIWNGKKRGNILIIYVYLDSQINTYM